MTSLIDVFKDRLEVPLVWLNIHLQCLALLEGCLSCLVLFLMISFLILPAVVRRNETPTTQIEKDFGISDAVIRRWLSKTDFENGLKPVTAEI